MTKHLAVLMVTVVAISAGVTYAITGIGPSEAVSKTNAFLMGHAEIIVTDENGYVKAYRQADNAIVANGMNLLVNRTFADINATTQQVNWMHIGTNDTNVPAWDDTGLFEPIGGCAREDASFTTPFAVNSGGFAQIVVNGTATFLGATCAAQSIDETGVFTKSSGGAMFARNTFNDVDLESADELTLKWDFVFTDS